jgi:hypothetical protein
MNFLGLPILIGHEGSDVLLAKPVQARCKFKACNRKNVYWVVSTGGGYAVEGTEGGDWREGL